MFELETRPARINPWISLLKQQLRRFHRPKQGRSRATKRSSSLTVERLEDRTLLAGPELVAILPNVGSFLNNGEIRNEAPGELTLRFSPGQIIDSTTVAGGINIVRSGADGIIGNGNDVTVTPGFLGIGTAPNEVVFRFSSTLPDDLYQINVIGSGASPLRNTNIVAPATVGEAFNNGVNLNFNFELDLGARITAVVPQPVLRDKVFNVLNPALIADGNRFTINDGFNATRTFEFDNGGAVNGSVLANGNIAVAIVGTAPNQAANIQAAVNGSGLDVTTSLGGSQVTLAGGAYNPSTTVTGINASAMTLTEGGLTQRLDIVTVYFNSDPLDPATANIPGFYQLIDAATGVIQLPTTVSYSSANNTAKLRFSSSLTTGTYRLRVGESNESNNTTPTQQILRLGGTPTGGTFTLTFNSQTTAAIPFNASAADVQTALETLSNIDVGDLVVSGGPLPSSPVTIQFQGQFAFRYVPKLTGSASGLTGGTSPSITVNYNAPVNVGTLFTSNPFASSAFLGDDSGTTAANDVDLYRFTLTNAGTIGASVIPQPALNTYLRLFNSAGVEISTSNTGGSGAADSITVAAGAGTYYIGVSSTGNQTYNAITGANATGGTSSGAYTLSINSTVALPTSDDNSSFSTASDLGVLGDAGHVVNSSISPQTVLLYPPEPGGTDEPGHRSIPLSQDLTTATAAENHLFSTGTTPAALSAITVQSYFFGDVYGTDPQGNLLRNAITVNQRQRTREIFDLLGHYAGIQFQETVGTGIQVVTGDIRAISPTTPPNNVRGLAGVPFNSTVTTATSLAIMNASQAWGNSEFGGDWMEVALHEIGHALGLQHSTDVPSFMSGSVEDATIASNGITGEAVFPGDHDLVNLLRLYAPDSSDIDLYRIDVSQSGQFTAETLAERLTPSQSLDTALVLYRQVSLGVREVVARNDNYFGSDSLLSLRLDPGTYFVGVSSTGNTNYDPRVSNSGYGGTTDGNYSLRLGFAPDANTTLTDADNMSSANVVTAHTALDGNADGLPGGAFDFWFESGNTIFVDKAANSSGANGSLTNPYNNLATAITAIGSRIVVPPNGGTGLTDGQTFTVSDGINTPTIFEFDNGGASSGTVLASGNVAVAFSGGDPAASVAGSIATAVNSVAFTLNSVATANGDRVDMTNVSQLDLRGTPGLLTAANLLRIVGNGGTDGNLLTPSNATPYLIGRDNSGNTLPDGRNFDIPQGVTVMIDSGAVFKLEGTIVDVGTSSVNVNRSQGALQVLGTRALPDLPSLAANAVYFTSFRDDSLGGDSDGVSTGAAPGQWGGLVFRQDSDRDPQAAVSRGVFLNSINGADLRFGGGGVTVNSQLQVFNPIHLETERPTITYNAIASSADSAISGDPNSFEETRFGGNIPDRIGPRLVGNRMTGNSVNGVFLRVRTQFGNPVDKLDVSARLDDTDAVYVVTENLHINGNPGGTVAVNESQRVSITGAPTGGTFTLTFNGQTTAPIAHNAPTVVGTNEIQRVSFGGSPSGGTFTLTVVGETFTRLVGAISANQTALTVNSNAGFPATPFTLRVENELMTVTGVVGTDLTVTRGVGGTTAVAHLNNDKATVVQNTTVAAPGIGNQVTDVTLTVADATGFLASGFDILVENEIMTVTARAGNTLTVNRGQRGTLIAPHAAGVGVSAAQTTAAIAFNASPSTGGASVQSRLSALTNINSLGGASNAQVTGGPGPNTPYDVTFIGNLAGLNLAQMIADGTSLTGGLSPSVTVSTVTQGVTSVQSALEALSNVNPGDVAITGGPLPNSPVTVSFAGQYTGQNLPLMTTNGSGLTGGTAPAVGATAVSDGNVQGRTAGQLVIDPGIVVKLKSTRIELERGSSQLIAEGTAEKPIRFTSLNDDTVGSGGTFDTSGNGTSIQPAAGDWGGLMFNAVSKGSLDDTRISYAGGTTPIEGAFDQFAPIEIHQADVRLANSILENNAGGAATTLRNGRGSNASSTIFVRGAQPIILNNILQDNGGSAISINANALTSEQLGDTGHVRGTIERFPELDDNSGPLVRLNRMDDNGKNGMQVRGEELTVESVWDDTDIVHILDQIDPTSATTTDALVTVNNHATYSGLRLESDPTSSLVVKLRGNNAGLTANGVPLDIDDRIGGTVQVVGQPGYPVVLTSLQDCSVGAGFKVDGQPLLDTLNTGKCEPGQTVVGTSGAVLIDGSDRDAHGDNFGPDGQVNTPDDANRNGWQFIQQAVNFAYTGSRNNGPMDVLVIGATAGGGGGGGGGFGQGNALGAISSVTAALALNQTVVTGNAISTVNFSDYRVIYVPSSLNDTPGGVTNTDLDLLAARRGEIQSFVNSGGSIVALTEAAAAAASRYTWLQLPQPFLIQTTGLASGPCNGGFGGGGGGGGGFQQGTGELRLTQAAISAGFALTAAELCNGAPYHNAFIGPPGFNGLVPFVLDWGVNRIAGDSDDAVIALGLQSGSFGIGFTNPANAGDWRSIVLDRYSNDRNVALYNEREAAYTGAIDANATPVKAELLGTLAPNEKSADDVSRLGFEVHGFIAADDATDVDIYSFFGTAGSEVWLDIDRTSSALDTMLELIDANGTVLARALDNSTRTGTPSTLALDMIEDVDLGGDYYTVNPKDAGVRVILPGTPGQTGIYFVRVRSQPVSGNENTLEGGLTTGRYQLQVRLRQRDEKPGSVVSFGDIRYAATGVDVRGLPAHSPLAGDTAEPPLTDTNNNGVFDTETRPNNSTAAGVPQQLGNLLSQDRNTISVSGSLTQEQLAGQLPDVDFYQFTVDYQQVQQIATTGDAAKTWPVVIDIDYADGLARPDTTMALYDENNRLIGIARDSDVFDDQPAPGQDADLDDLSRGSVGKLDPYFGTIHLSEATAADDFYNVAVSANNRLPTQLDGYLNATATVPTIRLEPVDSVTRVVEDHIGFSGYTSNGARLGVQPTTPRLFDISSAVSLNTHVRSFNLSDVTLFITSTSGLSAVDPLTGAFEYLAGNGNTYGGNNPMADLGMRSDGTLFGYRSLTNTNQANNAGALVTIDPATGIVVTSTPDAIPDGQFGVLTNTVSAFAWQQFQGNGRYDNLFYSVDGGTSSILCRADPDTFVSGLDPASSAFSCRLGQPITAPGVTGLTTGMAFLGNQLLGVSSGGQFYQVLFSGGAVLRADLSTATGTGFLALGEQFTGLAVGPQNVAGGPNNTAGFYANMLFALTNFGRLVALNANGVPQAIFDGNNDGLADATSVNTQVGTGLAFSPLDINLWHPTIARGREAGHGINFAFNNSRTPDFPLSVQNGEIFSELEGGASFYFGLEEFNSTNNPRTYFTFGPNAQYGGTTAWQRDLTSNATIGATGTRSGNYNLPGGAYGSLLTDAFSLEGSLRTDKPTLYFNYFLETQNANFNDSRMRDAARVLISRDGGANWELLATNNSILSTPGTVNSELPAFKSVSADADNRFSNQQVQELYDTGTTGWRQARVDLANYAGQTNLRLRFDFSTAGEIDPRPGETALPLRANLGNTNSSERSQNNDFEGFYIDDIIVGFAERGELVTRSAVDNANTPTTYLSVPLNPNPGAPTEQLTGEYQLEIRRGTEYATQPRLNSPNIVIASPVFDTNERLVNAITIDAPVGSVILDGQQFSVSDGIRTVTFEFDNNSAVTAGNIPVTFSAASSSATMSQNIRSAILGVAGFGVNAGVGATGDRVLLIGATSATPITTLSNITLTLDQVVINEDGSQTATGTITRGVVTNQGLTVTLTLPVNGSDVFVTTTSVVIPPNTASGNFFVFGNDDAVYEGPETVVIQASAPGYHTISTSLDILDNDPPALTVSIAPGSVSETSPAGTAVATITRNTPTNVPLSVTVRSLDPSEILLPAVTSGAAVAEVETNDSIFGAQNVDIAGWSTNADANILNATTIPHITINGVGNGTFDYYSFSATAGSRGIFDIDATSFGVNTELFLYTSAGVLLANSDDSATSLGAGGSTSGNDSFIDFTFASTGTFVLGVGAFNSFGNSGGITGATLAAGTYTLQVSVTGHAIPTAGTSTTVVIPAGQTSITVPLQTVQDFLVDGNQVTAVAAFAPGLAAGTGTVTVTDPGAITITVNVVAASVSEGAGAAATTGTVTINQAQSVPLTINLLSNDTSEATVPPTVTIPAGSTVSPSFNVSAVNDPVQDGNQTVTIIAYLSGVRSANDTLVVQDEAGDPPATMGVPGIGRNFTGSDFNQSGSIPPDTMGAVGLNHIVEFINGVFAVYNKASGALAQPRITDDQFWINAGVTPVNGAFDPRIIYDPTTSRWFAVQVDNALAANNLLLAVSNSSDPTTGWTGFSIDTDPTDLRWADYPTLGVDADGVYVGLNMFPIAAGPTQETSIVSIPKADLIGVVPTIANRTFFQNVNATVGFSVQPAVDFGATDGRAVFLAASSGGGNQLRRFNVLGAGGAGASLSAAAFINVPAYVLPGTADQPGPSQDLDGNDSRLAANVLEVGNSLWVVHGVLDGGTNNDAIRWYEIDETTNAVLQTGLISDPALEFIYPSIAVNPLGDVVIGFTGTGNGAGQFPSTYVTIGDTVAGTTTFGAPLVTQVGGFNYVRLSNGVNRWGDYSATVVDPTDPGRFWTFQEWVEATDIWSIQMTEVVIPLDQKDLIVTVTGTDPIAENAGNTASTASVTRTNTTGPLTVTLTSSDTSEVTLNGSGTGSITLNFIDGQATIASIALDAVDDLLSDGTQTVFLTASAAGGWNSVIDTIDVTDNDPVLTVTVNIPATTLLEGNTTTGTVSRTGPVTSALNVTLTSSDATQATVPFLVTIPIGSASTTFTVTGVADGINDGYQNSVITPSAATFAPVSDVISVFDTTTPTITLNIVAPIALTNSMLENAGAEGTTGTITISQAQSTPLIINLLSSDTTEATVPATVLIPAGSTSASFFVSAVDEFFDDGSQLVTFTAYANGFRGGRDTLNIVPVTGRNSTGIDSYNRLGDQNLQREQGHIQIKNNIIRDVSLYGIRVDEGARDAGSNSPHPGSVINTPTLNTGRLVPGVLLENNTIANIGTSGIFFSGDPNTGVVPLAPVPFGRLVNNTIYGGDTPAGNGIEITGNAAPTLMNNIIANTAASILLDAGSRTNTVIGTGLYQNNDDDATNTDKGTNAIQLADTDALFIDPLTFNFYLAPGSQAIDSSLNSLADRPAIVAVKSPLGIPQSPVFAPDFDLYGQLRVDDPAQTPPPGLGSNIFKDRGAVERADFAGPFAVMVSPEDNDPAGTDLNSTVTIIHRDNPGLLTQFIVGLRDSGIGVDDNLVQPGQFAMTRNGTTLIAGSDYIFTYNANTNEVIFTSPSTFALDSLYTITIDNSTTTGVKDFAGNSLQNNQTNGTTRFTIVVTDGDNDKPVNSIPTAAQSTNEDTPLVFNATNGNLISVSDSDAFLGNNTVQMTLTATNGLLTLSQLTGLSFVFNDANGQGDGDGLLDANMAFRGTFTNVNAALAGLTFTPNANFNGTATLTITSNDLGNFGPPPSLPSTDTDVVTITIVAVNDAPTLDQIANITINEESGTQTVNLTGITIGPANEAPQTLTVTATSSNTALIPDPTVTYTSPSSTGTLMFTPVANASGIVTITVTVTDNGSNVSPNVNTFQRTFQVNLNAVNDEPFFDLIANQQVLEDSGATGITITGVTPGDGTFEANQTITFTAVSSDPTIVPNPTVAYSSGSTATLTVAPASNMFGTVTITVTAQDNGGTASGGDDSFSRTFTLTVTPVNDPPTLNTIGNVSVLEDSGATLVNLAGIDIGPANEAPQNLTVTATSSNTSIIPNPTVTYTSANATGTLSFTPVPNATGTATITVQVRDNGGTANNGVDTFTRTFTVTVTPVNDEPTFDAINNLAILEDPTPIPQTISITGVGPGGGTDEAGQSIAFVAASSNTAIIPNPTVTGTGSTRTLSFTPVANANGGPVTITVTATDSGGTANGGDNVFSRTFVINVTSVNDAPTLNPVTSPAAILEDAGQQTISFSGITAGPADEVAQTLTVTAVSSDTSLIPNPVVTYGGGTSGTLAYTPAANAFGAATITVTVADSGGTANGGLNTFSRTFTVSVTGVNDAPTLDLIGNRIVDEDSGATIVGLTGISIGPGNEAPQTLTITATSNNPGVVPNPTVTYTSPSALGSLALTPAPNANGTATITVNVSDSGGTANGGTNTFARTFTVTVNAVNDAPVNNVPGTQTTNDEVPRTFSTGNGNAITLSDVDSGTATVRLALFPINGSVSLASTTGVTILQGDGSSGIGYVVEGTITNLNAALNGSQFRPATDFNGTATLQITTNDLGNTGSGGAQSDTDTISITVNDVNDAPVNSLPATQTISEGTTRIFNDANGNRISVNDVDARGQIEQVTLTGTNGLMSLGTTAGLTFTSGDGTQDSSMSFTGTLANINTALNNLAFFPSANFNGSASITITSNDLGNSGSGGALSDTDTVFLNVTPVNNPPTISNLAANLRMALAGQPFTITYASLLAALSGTDVDGDIVRLRVEQLINGTLTKDGVAVTPTVTSIGPGESLTWTAPANFNGSLAAFVVRGIDPSGAVSANSATVTIDVATITRYLRAYNPRTDYHFFTTSQSEFNNAITRLGYRDETTARTGFAVATGPAPATHAIHRLYNPNNNRHYYTADSHERDVLVTLGYRYEKDEGFIFTEPVPGTTTIYRLYNNNTGTHLLVESAAQRDAILSQFPGIWVRHADFGFAFPVSASGSPPIVAFARSGSRTASAAGGGNQSWESLGNAPSNVIPRTEFNPGLVSQSYSETIPRTAFSRSAAVADRPLVSTLDAAGIDSDKAGDWDRFWSEMGTGPRGDFESDSQLSHALWGED